MGAVFGDLLVAIGVAGEVLAGVVAHLCQNELTRRSNDRLSVAEKEAAEARQRTAEIEQLTAWRELSPEQRQSIIDGFKDIPDIRVVIEYQAGNPESFMFAQQVASAFDEARITNLSRGPNS